MSFDISNMINNAIDGMKKMVDTDSVVGKPVYCDDETTIIPINKITIGFVTAGAELDTKNKVEESPIGGLGGGLTITPLGFLVVSGGDSHMIKVEGDNSDRWMEILQNLLKSLKK